MQPFRPKESFKGGLKEAMEYDRQGDAATRAAYLSSRPARRTRAVLPLRAGQGGVVECLHVSSAGQRVGLCVLDGGPNG